MMIFLDTEFTDLDSPWLLSLGLVSLDGRDFYAEIDLASPQGRALKRKSSTFAHDTVFEQWGRVPDAAVQTLAELGQRTAVWLLELAAEQPEQRLIVGADYKTDHDLLVSALLAASSPESARARALLAPLDLSSLCSNPVAEAATDEFFRNAFPLGGERHHALTDAQALRAAFIATGAQLEAAAGSRFPDEVVEQVVQSFKAAFAHPTKKEEPGDSN